MKPIKLNLVFDHDDIHKPGDAHTYIGKDNLLQLFMICPGCGEGTGSAGKHVFNEKTLTYHPSIVHDEKLGGCGWHGWLKNGIFTEV